MQQSASAARALGRIPLKGKRPAILQLSAAAAKITLEPSSDVVEPAEKISYPPVPTFRECMTFAVNAVGIYAAPTLMSLIDAAFIGRVSTTELAALGPGSSISDSMPFFLIFVSVAATNLVATSSAANDIDGSRRIARTALAFGALGGGALALVTTLGAGALSRFYCGTNVVLAPLCAQYVGIRALALPAVVVASVAQALCIGIKDTRTPMLAVVVAACLNLLGDLLFVSVLGLGIAGAAWATALSQLCSAALLLRVLSRRGLLDVPARSLPQSQQRPPPNAAAAGRASPATHRATLIAICSFASFIFVMSVKVGMHNLCAATAASLGGPAAAAHTALMAVAWLCFTFGDVGSSLAQAYLPAFSSMATASEATPSDSPSSLPVSSSERPPVSPPADAISKAISSSPPTVQFDVAAAWPTIQMLLRVACSISLLVVGLSSTIIGGFAGQLSPDVTVQRQMRRVLPLMLATLATHSTAVTLEGLLLARKAFRALAVTYAGVAISVAAALAFVRSSRAGLAGVWGVYVWYCFGRVIAFAGFGGLLRRGVLLRGDDD